MYEWLVVEQMKNLDGNTKILEFGADAVAQEMRSAILP